MDISALINALKEQVSHSDLRGVITFDEDMLASLSKEDAKDIIAQVGSTHLMRLPEKEIHFFEWLKEYHPLVWKNHLVYSHSDYNHPQY